MAMRIKMVKASNTQTSYFQLFLTILMWLILVTRDDTVKVSTPHDTFTLEEAIEQTSRLSSPFP